MDLKEYRELIKEYFTDYGFALSPEKDKEKGSDQAILDCIIREHPEIGNIIYELALEDSSFFTRSMYDIPTKEMREESEKIIKTLKYNSRAPEETRVRIFEKILVEGSQIIDYRRMLLNTVEEVHELLQLAKDSKEQFGKNSVLADGKYVRTYTAFIKEVGKILNRFRPNVEYPEIYKRTVNKENGKFVFDIKCLNWDELISGKARPRKRVDLGLTTAETKIIEKVIKFDDIKLISSSYEYGDHVERMISNELGEYKKIGKISDEKAIAIIKEKTRTPEYQSLISPEKYHFIALYRLLENLEHNAIVEREVEFRNLPEAIEKLQLARKLIGLVEKDKAEGRRIKEPFMITAEFSRISSIYRYDDDMLFDEEDPIELLEKIDIDDITNFYHGVSKDYADRIVQRNPMAPIELYQKKAIPIYDFVEYLLETDGKAQTAMLHKAYEKKVLDEASVREIANSIDRRNKENSKKIGIAEIQLMIQKIKNKKSIEDPVFNELLLTGIINQDLLIKQYLNGMIKIDELNHLVKYIEGNEELRGKVDYSKIKFDPQTLAQVYTQLNLKNIVNILINKEHFDKELLSEFIKARPYLIKDCTKEQLSEFRRTFLIQGNLLKQLNVESQIEFMKSLGIVADIHGIAFDLFDKGLISSYVAERFGGADFTRQYKSTQLTDGLRHNDLENIKNLINAYNHGRISLSKILKRYVEGTLKAEMYFAFKENRDMTDAIDMPYLLGLYDKYNKTGKKEDLDILQKYYEEFKSIVKDEELLEIINKKQLELINSRKNKNSVVTMARSGVIDKDNIVMMDLETIAQLIMSGNTLNRETAKKLFRDIDGTTTKRDKLEELFKMEILTQDEMFTILSNVYVGNTNSTPEQEEIDANNMGYFLEKDYFESQYGEIGFKGESTRHNKKGVGVIKNEQQRFPIKERIEFLYSLDTKDSVNYKAGPAIIVQLPGKNKVIIETLGTPGKNGAKTESDLTNHCTYIVDRNVFEGIKAEIFEEKVAMTKKRRQEVESVLMYRKLIDLYNEHGKEIGMKRFRHNRYWESSLLKYFEEPEDKGQKEIKMDDKDLDD